MSAKEAKTVIRQSFPELEVKSIAFAGEGLDSRAFFVNDTYVFRFQKFPKVAKGLEVEVALLPKLQKRVHTPLPHFEFIGRSADNRILVVGYRKIVGVPLKDLWPRLKGGAKKQMLKALGTILQEIHSFPLKDARKCGVREQNFRRVYRADLTKVMKDIYPLIPEATREYLGKLYAQYLRERRNFAYTPSLLHADFSPDHIFCDKRGAHIAGVIDFGDVSIGDPDYDFMYLFGEFGWAFILELLQYHSPTSLDPDLLRQKLRLLLVHNTADDIWIGRDRRDQKMQRWALGNLKNQVRKMRESDFY